MSKLTWLHISDIHFSPKKEWRDSASRESLIDYLVEHFKDGYLPKPDLIFCTGDIAFGNMPGMPLKEQYDIAQKFFDEILNICGTGSDPFPKDNLFLVPGNHDVNRKSINSDAQLTLENWASDASSHIDKINQRFADRSIEFSSAISRLDEYGDFIKRYLPHQSDPENRHVYSTTRTINTVTVGIAGFNSAWTCAGDEDDRNIWLAGQWQFNTANKNLKQADIKIGLIHHPVDWLNTADRDISTIQISANYDFWLHGHTHNSWVSPLESHVVIGAGAVGAEASEEFGFNLVSIDYKSGIGEVLLHTKKKSSDWTIAPVAKHAPLGRWNFKLNKFCPPEQASDSQLTTSLPKHAAPVIDKGNSASIFIERQFKKRLTDALKLFSSNPVDWITPTISRHQETNSGAEEDGLVDLASIVKAPHPIVIKAPPQYGLTCLSHYLIHAAWCSPDQQLWLYLDAQNIKANSSALNTAVQEELELTGFQSSDVKCIILDSWSAFEKDDLKLFNLLTKLFPTAPIICMQHDDINRVTTTNSVDLGREFETLYLWPLSREKIRKFVASYNEKKTIGDEDSVTSRIIADMDVLNLHRTPLNCLTLLKVSEIDFDESPVNRSEIIKRVLFLLFNIDDIPTYKLRPDLKDCEYVLGYFCEYLIRQGDYVFSRDGFLRKTQDCCQERLIDLEINVVFDVLHRNNIIISRNNMFSFRFAYWVYYFAAQRMHHETTFSDYIFSDMRYMAYPEMIEFYTGIDRRREDALRILSEDLRQVRTKVEEDCGLPPTLNPYKFGKWVASEKARKLMADEVANGVAESNLPAEIKDRYADRDYDRAKPHDQNISTFLSEHSFDRMMSGIRAAARALRNSDYASLDLKRELLNEILLCWEQASKVILVVLPTLAVDKHAIYDGVYIILNGKFGDTPEQRFGSILAAIPAAVTRMFADDLFSMKMGPLLIDKIKNHSTSEIIKHELMLLAIIKRPRDWNREVEKYINTVQHNSFYLMDINRTLRNQYKYAFISTNTLKDIEHLMKAASAKHFIGTSSVGAKKISQIDWKDFLPERNPQ
ncbi:metallophosphoesterase [Pseudomonas sp. Y39-6]|uniref:metallophosphoesterase n=1 Tax=Pseudomonas sp. Y39-6 TaxID=2749807 RepID=UPI00190FD195|nr:metallophosphoesterase [Pseudomonas sp. Y39-6]QPO18246.1 metallophosphoesterase [Pseudomonas sp. Y39-6]URS61362.1 metallophosphoesterase [Pseudomonas sp. Y39-6]